MTMNQLILLFDCYRGHCADIHPATHGNDKLVLINMGLINSGCNLTSKGSQFCEAVKSMAGVL